MAPRTVVRTLVGAALAAAFVLAATGVRAADAADASGAAAVAPAAPADPTAPADPAVRAAAHPRGYHLHDGFYLSLALGPSYAASAMTTSGASLKDVTTGAVASSIGTSIDGFALSGQLLMGGTPAPGLVVGGGTMGNFVFSPTRSWNGVSRPMHAYSFGLIGPFVDYYLDPREGLHFQALLGVADGAENASGSTSNALWGYGGSIGFGNEWWVADDWGLGVMLRGQVVHLAASTDANAYGSSPGNPDLMGQALSESQTAWSLALLMTATYQ